MKILISISYYSPHISGLTIATKNLAELLAKKGYQITVLTTQHNKTLPKQENINNVFVKRIPYIFKLYKGFIMPGFAWAVYKALRKSDQVIINLPQAEGFIIAILATLMKKKIHCYYHCNLIFDSRARRAKLMRFIFRVADTITLSLTKSIIMSSDDFAKHSSLFAAYHRKITIIPLVIKQPIISQTVQQTLGKKLISKKQYVIGFIGRIAAEKGIEYLMEAIPLLQQQLDDNFMIVFAGPDRVIGEQTYQERIAKYFEKYSDTIVRLGELEEHELGAFYSLIDVLVLPSINNTEAFGMVQVEAMLCGTPVIVSDLPGVRVPVQKTHMGEIIPFQNSSKLAEAIVKVLTKKEHYKKNHHEVAAQFSEEIIVAQWQKLFGN